MDEQGIWKYWRLNPVLIPELSVAVSVTWVMMNLGPVAMNWKMIETYKAINFFLNSKKALPYNCVLIPPAVL